VYAFKYHMKRNYFKNDKSYYLTLTFFFYGKFHVPYGESTSNPPTPSDPTSLIPLLHSGYIVMKLFILFITNGSYLVRKEAEVRLSRCGFSATYTILTYGSSVTHFVWFWGIFPPFLVQNDLKDFHTANSTEFNFLSKFSSNITF
jgi:hypothetical protein